MQSNLARKSKLIIAIIAVTTLTLIAILAPLKISETHADEISESSAESGETCKYHTSAECAILIDNNGVLFEKNADKQRGIASTTKILTAITVLKNCDDIEKVVEVPDCAIGVEGSSIYLEKGEKLKIKDLLYGLMLRSGNDCAVALATIISGSVDEFALLMNYVAKEAGAVNSHFTNPHGLTDEQHYSTARDLALITAYAMKNDTFREIVGTRLYNDCPYADKGYNRVMKNKNKILDMVEGGTGVKTGYTEAAGRCLVSAAKRGEREVICVVLNCGPMFEESAAMIEQAFEE